MRYYLLAAVTLLGLCSLGCRGVNMCQDCGNCNHHGMIGHHNRGHNGNGHYANVPHGAAGYKKGAHHREYVGPQGPPTAQVAYPYYTTRGPRDFLLDNPPSIGR